MTCIIGFIDTEKRKMYMGGDSAGISGYDLNIREDSKVFKKNDMLFGYTSSFRMGQILQFSLNLSKRLPRHGDDLEYLCTVFIDDIRKALKGGGYTKIDNNIETGGYFLLAYRGIIYKIASDFQIGQRVQLWDSIGCGESYALGAIEALSDKGLSSEAIINKSLEIASKYSCGVHAPFNIIEAKY